MGRKRVNKAEFLDRLYDKNIDYRIGELKIVGDLKGMKTKIYCKDKYGLLDFLPDDLLRGKIPTINSSVFPNLYFANQAKEIHGEKYNYENVDYQGLSVKIEIICPIHGKFYQLPNSHLRGNGCEKCGFDRTAKHRRENPCGFKWGDWEVAGYRSKHFDAFKLYVIRCFNENECFYKIGKTFTTVEFRFNGNDKMPYQYEILQEIKGTPKEICELEVRLQNLNKINKYQPNLKFRGSQECFKLIYTPTKQ